MSLDPERLARLGELENKAGVMNVLTRLNIVRIPRVEPITLLSQGVLSLHISGTKIRGQENLEEAIEKSQERNKGIIFTFRHRADADSLAFRNGMVNLGHKDIADKTVFIAGVNMLRRLYILPFSSCEEVIYIATPEDLEQSRNLIVVPTLSPTERRRIKWVDAIFHEINNKAKACVKESASQGKNLAFYPEGGRSKDGFLRRPPREVSIFFPQDETMVVPIVFNGTEQINPPGESWGPYKMLPENRQELEVIIGSPYPSYEIWEWSDSRKGKAKNPADWALANIANAYPLGIREEDYIFFEEIIRSFRPERNRMLRAA